MQALPEIFVCRLRSATDAFLQCAARMRVDEVELNIAIDHSRRKRRWTTNLLPNDNTTPHGVARACAARRTVLLSANQFA